MIYLDNAATTRPDDKSLEFASVFNDLKYFNPSSLYAQGIENSKELKTTKDIILKSVGLSAATHEVIFTSCGSESDNQAIFCAKKRGVFVTSKGEHSAVYKSFLELKNRGLTIEFIDLKKDGSVDEEKLYDFVSKNKVDFVSIMHVNNETGAINDINLIASKIKLINKNLIFHSDGVQAFGKIPFMLNPLVDLYSISAHKINALKGVGALIKRKNLVLAPLIFGGGQENNLRSGTENVFGIKVFEHAVSKHYNNLKSNFTRVKELWDYCYNNLDKEIFEIISNENGSPYIFTASAKGVRGEVLMHSLEESGIIIGNGSACSSKNPHSRVIEACGFNKDVLSGVIRISFSYENSLDEIVFAVDEINKKSRILKGIIG